MLIANEVHTLAELRSARGVTQAAIARAARSHHTDVSRFENEVLQCTSEWLSRFIDAYAAECGVSAEEVQALLPARYREKAGAA
jgi:transcriptional regulator with XRE-family HTH domain